MIMLWCERKWQPQPNLRNTGNPASAGFFTPNICAENMLESPTHISYIVGGEKCLKGLLV